MVASTPGNRKRRRTVWLIGGLGALAVVVIVVVGIAAGWQRLSPWHRPTPLERAEQAMARGDVLAAQTALLEYLSRFPDAADVRYRLAVLLKKTDAETALIHFRQIPPDSDHYLAAARHIAQICILAGRNDEAEHALKVLEQADPDDHAVQLSLAELYFHWGKQEQARVHALRAIELNPNRVQTYLLLAEILDELRRPSEMIAPLKQAIELDPDQYQAHLNLAYAYQASGLLTEAQREAHWCLERKPDEFFARRTLALAARDEGRLDAAQREVAEALKLKPDDIECRILEADLLMYRHQPEEAYQRLKPLYAKHQDSYRYLGSLARAAAASGRMDEARTLHEAITLHFQSKIDRKLELKQDRIPNGETE